MKVLVLECKKCGYIWKYSGKKLYATCPNCYTKVKVEVAQPLPTKLKRTAVSQTAKVTQETLQNYGFSVSIKDLEQLISEILETVNKEK